MKHLLLHEQGTTPASFISDFEKFQNGIVAKTCNFQEIERFACDERFDGAVIVALKAWKNQRLEVLRGKFPERKIVLICEVIGNEIVKELQNSKKVIDLFFKSPTAFDQIATMFDAMTSAQTATVQVDVSNDDDLEIESNDKDDDDFNNESIQVGSNSDEASGGGLMNLLQGEGEEEDEEYDSQDISRILKSEVLLEELNKSKQRQDEEASEENQARLNEHFTAERTKTMMEESPASYEDNSDDSFDDDMPVVFDEGDKVYEVKPRSSTKKEKKEAPPRAPSVPDVKKESVAKTSSVKNSNSRKEEGLNKSTHKSASSEEVNQLMRHREDDYLKLLSRNEILEEENRILREKVISLEEVANSASFLSKKKTLESDEHKIKVAVLKRRHREELDRISRQLDLEEERTKFLEEKSKKLEEDLKASNKQKLIDVKKVRSREEELEEKLDLMKADVSMQIRNRENKIIELKRKIDLLHFDLKDSEERERELGQKISTLEEKLYQLKKVLGESIDKLEVISEIPLAKVKL